MDRRTFLIRSAMLAAGGLAVTMLPGVAEAAEMAEAAAKAAGDGSLRFDAELYHRFANPDSVFISPHSSRTCISPTSPSFCTPHDS